MAEEVVDTRYPKWKYHASEEPRVVNTEDEEKSLGEGWFNHPNDAKKPVEKAKSAK